MIAGVFYFISSFPIGHAKLMLSAHFFQRALVAIRVLLSADVALVKTS